MADDQTTPITLPDVFVTPQDQTPPPALVAPPKVATPADTMRLTTGGAIDLGKAASQIAPLDQINHGLIAQHLGLADPGVPNLVDIDKPMPPTLTMNVPQAVRDEYVQAVQGDHVAGADDYARKFVARGFAATQDAHPDATYDQYGEQLTNSANNLAASLPDHDELDVAAQQLAAKADVQPSLSGPPVQDTIKGNLLTAWQQTGLPVQTLMQKAQADPDFATQLATPPPPPAFTSPNFPAPGRDNPEDMFTPEQNLARNQEYAKGGPYLTELPPSQEAQFQTWVKTHNVNWHPGDKDYDMRGFFAAMQAGDKDAKPEIDPNDHQVHYPDKWKTPYAATFSNESKYAQPNAPYWEGDQYKTPDGKVLYDDRAGKWYGPRGTLTPEDTMKLGIPLSHVDLAQAVQAAAPESSLKRYLDTSWEALKGAGPDIVDQVKTAMKAGKTMTQLAGEQELAQAGNATAQPANAQQLKEVAAALESVWPLLDTLGIHGDIAGGFVGAGAIKNIMKDEGGAGPNLFQQIMPTMTYGAEGRKQALDMTKWLRNHNGQKQNITDIASNLLEGMRKELNVHMPAHRQFLADTKAWADGYTAAKDAWEAAGKDMAKFKYDAPPPLSEVQKVWDHIQERPDGGRIDPADPLYPVVEHLKGVYLSMKDYIEKNLDYHTFLQDYAPGMYKDPDRAQQAFTGPLRGGYGGNLHQKTIPTVYDALLRGVELRYANPLDAAYVYIQRMSAFIEHQKVIETGHGTGQIVRARTAPEPGWVKLKGQEFKPTRTVEQEAADNVARLARLGPPTANDIRLGHNLLTNERPDQAQLPPQGGWMTVEQGNWNAREDPMIGHNGGPRLLSGPEDGLSPGRPPPNHLDQRADVAYDWAHPSMAAIYNHWKAQGLLSNPASGALFNMWRAWTNTSVAVKLGLTLAHAVNIVQEEIFSGLALSFAELGRGQFLQGLQDFGLSVIPPARLGADWMRGKRFQNIYLDKPGLTKTPMEELVNKLFIEAGGRPLGRGDEMAIGNAKNLLTAWKNGGLTERVKEIGERYDGQNGIWAAVKTAGQLFGDVAHTASAWLFENIIPKMKVANFSREMASYLLAHPQASEEEMSRWARMILDTADWKYGEMNMENTFTPRVLKQGMASYFLSTGWFQGTWSAFGRGSTDLLTGHWSTPAARWVVGWMLGTAAVTAAYEGYRTGHLPTSPQDFATNFSQFLNPGKEFTDIYTGAYRAFHSTSPTIGMVNETAHYFANKAAPGVRPLIDFAGSPTVGAWVSEALGDVAPMIAGSRGNREFQYNWIENVLGFHPPPQVLAHPEVMGPAYDKKAVRQTIQEQWREYYQDQNSAQPQGLPRPPNEFGPRKRAW